MRGPQENWNFGLNLCDFLGNELWLSIDTPHSLTPLWPFWTIFVWKLRYWFWLYRPYYCFIFEKFEIICLSFWQLVTYWRILKVGVIFFLIESSDSNYNFWKKITKNHHSALLLRVLRWRAESLRFRFSWLKSKLGKYVLHIKPRPSFNHRYPQS